MSMETSETIDNSTLPSLPEKESALLPITNDFYKTAFQFQQIMMIYESAIKQIETKLSILSKEINVHIELPKLVRGKVDLGKEYGYIEYKIGDVCLEKIPLIAQRTIKQSNPFIYLADLIAQVAFYF